MQIRKIAQRWQGVIKRILNIDGLSDPNQPKNFVYTPNQARWLMDYHGVILGRMLIHYHKVCVEGGPARCGVRGVEGSHPPTNGRKLVSAIMAGTQISFRHNGGN